MSNLMTLYVPLPLLHVLDMQQSCIVLDNDAVLSYRVKRFICWNFIIALLM